MIFGRSEGGSELNLPSWAGEHYVIVLCSFFSPPTSVNYCVVPKDILKGQSR